MFWHVKATLDEDRLRKGLRICLDGVNPRLDLWEQIDLKAEWPRAGTHWRWAFAAAALVVVTVLALIASQLAPFRTGKPQPRIAVAQAFDALFKVKSVQVHVESETNRLAMLFGPLDEPVRGMPFSERYDYADCSVTPTYQSCVLVDKRTGQRVSRFRASGGKRSIVGSYVFPSRFFVRTTDQLDAATPGGLYRNSIWDGPMTVQVLYVDGKKYVQDDRTMSDAWTKQTTSPADDGLSARTLFWGLFEERPQGVPDVLGASFDTVVLQGGDVVQNVPVLHYQATRAFAGGAKETADFWIGQGDGLPRRITREYSHAGVFPGDIQVVWRDTYVFSNFNEHLELPNAPQ